MDWLEDFDPFHAAVVAFMIRFEQELASRWEKLEFEAASTILGVASGQKKNSLFTHFFEEAREEVAAEVHARFPSLLRVAARGRKYLNDLSPLAWTRVQIWTELRNFLGIEDTFDHTAPPRPDSRILQTAFRLSGDGDTPEREWPAISTLPKWVETGWNLSRLFGLYGDEKLSPRDKEPMSLAETHQWVKSQEFWMHRRLEKQLEREMYDAIIDAGGAGFSLLKDMPAEDLVNVKVETVVQPQPNESNLENQFCRNGDSWAITFAGETCKLRTTLGLEYIATLLQYPGKSFRALELRSLLSGVPEAGPRPPRSASELISEENSSGGADKNNARACLADSREDKVLDDTAIRELKGRLLELEGQIAERLSIGDAKTACGLEEEHSQIESYLGKFLNFRARSRLFSDDNEKARQSITKALKRAYESIEKQAPRTVGHLESQIETGAQFIYRDTVARWQVVRKP